MDDNYYNPTEFSDEEPDFDKDYYLCDWIYTVLDDTLNLYDYLSHYFPLLFMNVRGADFNDFIIFCKVKEKGFIGQNSVCYPVPLVSSHTSWRFLYREEIQFIARTINKFIPCTVYDTSVFLFKYNKCFYQN